MSDSEDVGKKDGAESRPSPDELSIISKLDFLTNSIDRISHRLEAVEVRAGEPTEPNRARARGTTEPNPEPHLADSESYGPRFPSTSGRPASRGFLDLNFADVRLVQATSEYENIRDRYKAVRLPEELKLHDSRTGVRREDQQQYNRLVRSARMVETTFRILSGLDPDSENLEDKLGDLFLVQFALLKYLQDEYAVLMVSGATNSETARIFRSFRRNASAFAPDVIEDLRNAATVVAAGQVATPRTQFSGFRGSRQGRGRGFVNRGGYNSSYGFRRFNNSGHSGNNHNNRGGYDPYSQLGRSVPFSRDNRDDNSNN